MHHVFNLSRSVLFIAAIAGAFFAAPSVAESPDPRLTLTAGEQTVTFTRAALLRRPDVAELAIAADPAYPGRPMRYRAIRVTALFDGIEIAADAVIQFKCLDGFAAPISKERLLNSSPAGSLAYIAIEPAERPWPALKPGGVSAGPFYLVWQQPEASFIGPEEWPYQLISFEVKGTFESVYPDILPDAALEPTSAARAGFAVFTKNCFACHTLNLAGIGDVGPDLNVPMNPTEYFQPAALRKLVRDPQSVRHFPRSRMGRFPPAILSEQELDQLIAYLEHMAPRKVLKPAPR